MKFSLSTPLNALALSALDALLPPLCLACDAPVGGTATLCPDCWTKTPFIAAPYCACCGLPFDIPVEDGTLCGACLDQKPLFAAARAVMLYDDFSRQMVLSFKHGDRTASAPAFAAWMQRAAASLLDESDALIPVPLHRWRLFKRRYNQSALLAYELARLTGKKVFPDLLCRLRATPAQGHMKRKERQDNVRGAFAVSPRAANMLRGKKLILIDDVLTTGATVNECARVLLAAGAAQVSVITLARVRGQG